MAVVDHCKQPAYTYYVYKTGARPPSLTVNAAVSRKKRLRVC